MRSRGRIFEATFLTADCTKTRLADLYPDSCPKQFDLVSCQFAFHYCFESEEQARCMVRNAAERLKPGGFFIGTTLDSSVILKGLREKLSHRRRQQRPPDSGKVEDDGDCRLGNSVFALTFDQDSPVLKSLTAEDGDGGKDSRNLRKWPQGVPSFGSKYYFHLEGVVDCPEFMVDFESLDGVCAEFDLTMAAKQGLEGFFKSKRRTPQGSRLLRAIKALEPYPASRSGGLVGDGVPGNYDVAKEFLERHYGRKEGDKWAAGEPLFVLDDREPIVVGTLSKEEWEAITLYCVFAYKRPSQPSTSSS